MAVTDAEDKTELLSFGEDDDIVDSSSDEDDDDGETYKFYFI